MPDDTAPAPNTNVTPGAAPATPAPPEVPSAFSLFKPSWEGLKLNIVELLLVWLVPTIALGILLVVGMGSIGLTGDSFMNGSSFNPGGGTIALMVALAVVILFIYSALIGPAIVHIQLQSSKMQKATYAGAWATSKKFWARFIGLSIVVGVVIFVGFLLLIVPGIIFLRRYFLAQYALIDQDLGIRESMHTSNELSKGRSGAIFGLIGVDILISLPNIIPFIGGLITFALQIAYFFAPAIRYEQLKALKPAAKPAA